MPNEFWSRSIKGKYSLIDTVWLVSMLMIVLALLIPFIQKAREAARRANCDKNFQRIYLALESYHTAFERYPTGWNGRDNLPATGPAYGWQSAILEYVDQQVLAETLRRDADSQEFEQQYTVQVPYTESVEQTYTVQVGNAVETRTRVVPVTKYRTEYRTRMVSLTLVTNSIVLQSHIPALRCPSDTMSAINTVRSGFGTSNYSGNNGSAVLRRWLPDRMSQWWPGAATTSWNTNGMFFINSFISHDYVPDGLSQTLLVSERCLKTGAGIWFGVESNQFENDQVSDCSHLSRPNHSYSSFSSFHPGGIQIVKADGATAFISDSIDSSDDPQTPGLYQQLGSRNDVTTAPTPVPYDDSTTAPTEPAPAAPAPPMDDLFADPFGPDTTAAPARAPRTPAGGFGASAPAAPAGARGGAPAPLPAP